MAEGYSARREHTLRPLPQGESWFTGGQRRRPTVRYDDPWLFDQLEPTGASASAPAQAPAGNGRRTIAFLALVSLAAIVTIIVVRQSGAPAEPAPLPAPPSHVITAVTRAQATTASIHVGEYLIFQLPGGRAYSTVLEQPSSQLPVAEALTLPGQQPQLRADSAGHAVIEVMSSPICNQPDGCAYERTFLGTVDLTVTP
jgi:hypothetical protein